jgi:hypothetical protein
LQQNKILNDFKKLEEKIEEKKKKLKLSSTEDVAFRKELE